MFQKIMVKLPKPLSLKEKSKTFLHTIGGEWSINKLNEKLLPLKKLKLIKKAQEKEDEIKRKLEMVNQSWNDWKVHIQWNELYCVNLRSCMG